MEKGEYALQCGNQFFQKRWEYTVYDWSLEIKPGLELDFTAQGIGGHWQNFLNLWCRKFEIFLHRDIDHKSDVLLGYVCFQKFAWRKDQQVVYCRKEYFIEIQQNPANVTTDQLGATIDPSSCYKYRHIFWGIWTEAIAWDRFHFLMERFYVIMELRRDQLSSSLISTLIGCH